jgi:hypothetical protein
VKIDFGRLSNVLGTFALEASLDFLKLLFRCQFFCERFRSLSPDRFGYSFGDLRGEDRSSGFARHFASLVDLRGSVRFRSPNLGAADADPEQRQGDPKGD